jgi:two-component system cell cycle sensor histidine kinase/response regulator CckA
VRTAAERATGLTRQLLTFTRQDRVRPEVLDINASITEAHAMLARTIGEHIHLLARPSPRPLTVFADAGHIQQILINLAVNARDAMPDGGTLVIEARETALDDDHVDLQPAPAAGRYVVIVVSDTGVGMCPEVAARIFEPFYTTKAKGQGTGLGLATVYGIATAAGGDVHLYSESGIGTTVTVILPAEDASTDTPAPDANVITEPATGAPPDETILMVEDEDDLRLITSRILTRAGYHVLAASGGAQAVHLAQTHPGPIHLLLTDVIMPKMTGNEVAARIRTIRPEIPVLYMSGYAQPVLTENGTLPDGVIIIEKPFTSHELLERVHNHLQHPHNVTTNEHRQISPASAPKQPSPTG